MKEYVWMYCFQCGTSQYFMKQAANLWRCPNCHATRPQAAADAAIAHEKASRAKQEEAYVRHE